MCVCVYERISCAQHPIYIILYSRRAVSERERKIERRTYNNNIIYQSRRSHAKLHTNEPVRSGPLRDGGHGERLVPGGVKILFGIFRWPPPRQVSGVRVHATAAAAAVRVFV